MFVHNSVKLTSLTIYSYCLDQDFEVCSAHLNSVYVCMINCVFQLLTDFLWVIFNTFLTNFDLLCTNVLILILLSVEALMLITLRRVIKHQLEYILQSFDLSIMVTFPTGIGSDSFSTIDSVFIDN